MADIARATYQGLTGLSIKLLANTTLVLLAAWIFMVIELGVKWYQSDEVKTVARAEHLLLMQLAMLPTAQCEASYCHPLEEISTWINDGLNDVSAVKKLSMRTKLTALSSDNEIIQGATGASILTPLKTNAKKAFQISWLALEIIITKAMILVLAMPLFAIAILIGIVDGLVTRDIRKFGVGRESAFLFHQAKHLLIPTVFIFTFIFMVMPVPVSPMYFILPLAISICFLSGLTASRFKKYL